MHAFHHTYTKDPDTHVLGECRGQKQPSMHHSWRQNVTASMVGFKNGHIRKNLTKNNELQRYSWESNRRRNPYDYRICFVLCKTWFSNMPVALTNISAFVLAMTVCRWVRKKTNNNFRRPYSVANCFVFLIYQYICCVWHSAFLYVGYSSNGLSYMSFSVV